MNIIFPSNSNYPHLVKSAIASLKKPCFDLLGPEARQETFEIAKPDLNTYLHLSQYDHYFDFLSNKNYLLDGIKCIWNVDFLIKSKTREKVVVFNEIAEKSLASIKMEAATIYSILNVSPYSLTTFVNNNSKRFLDIENIQLGRTEKIPSFQYVSIPFKLLLATLVCNKWSSLLSGIPIDVKTQKPLGTLFNNSHFVDFLDSIDKEVSYYATRTQIGFARIQHYSLDRNQKLFNLIKSWKTMLGGQL